MWQNVCHGHGRLKNYWQCPWDDVCNMFMDCWIVACLSLQCSSFGKYQRVIIIIIIIRKYQRVIIIIIIIILHNLIWEVLNSSECFIMSFVEEAAFLPKMIILVVAGAYFCF